MRKFFSKTYKIGNISISFILNEIIFLYRGKNRVYLKAVRLDYRFRKKKFIYISSIILSLILLIFSFYNYKIKEIDAFVIDEESKNRLLLSSKTDFSSPESISPLVIKYHTVKKGETLSEIAKEYGVSMDTICGSNRLYS